MKILKNSTYDTLINRINDANRERDVYQKKWSHLRDDLGDTVNKLRSLRAKTLDPLSNEKILINGKKGSGKTTLCLDIVKKLVQRNKYDKIFWLNPYDDFRLLDEEFYINAVEDTRHVEIFKDAFESKEFLKLIEYSNPSKPIMFIIDDPIFVSKYNKGLSILLNNISKTNVDSMDDLKEKIIKLKSRRESNIIWKTQFSNDNQFPTIWTRLGFVNKLHVATIVRVKNNHHEPLSLDGYIFVVKLHFPVRTGNSNRIEKATFDGCIIEAETKWKEFLNAINNG